MRCARGRFPFPLGPLLVRETIRTEVERGTLWIFEQEQSLANSTSTNVRMTAIRLASGGIWIHAPIAPTRRAALLRPRSLEAVSSGLLQHAAGLPSEPASIVKQGVCRVALKLGARIVTARLAIAASARAARPFICTHSRLVVDSSFTGAACSA